VPLGLLHTASFGDRYRPV